MPSISRKYRPKTFAEMVGQNHIKLTLQNELESDQTVQAYLFCGPRGLGKTTAARLLAKALNCTNRQPGESEPCNQCQSCLAINEARSLDLVEIDAASHTGVDNVRENIIDNVRFTPHQSKYKIFIIDEVHMLSISAFNALLKTLEEPPRHAIFILCTTEIHKVPETIISRCQRFDFKKIAPTETIKRLKKIATAENIKIDDEVFNIIAGQSEGCLRDAEVLLGQIFSLGSQRITKDQVALILPTSEIGLIIKFTELIFNKNIPAALEFVNQLNEEGIDLEIFTKELIEWLRKLILIKANTVKSDWLSLPDIAAKAAQTLLENINLLQIVDIIKIFLVAATELKSSLIPQLPLELAIVKICSSPEDQADLNINSNKPFIFKNPAIKRKSSQVAGSNQTKSDQSDSGKEAKVSLKDITNNWDKIIKASHSKGRDLLFINSNLIWPFKIIGNELEIGFKYDLHRDRFEANSNKDLFMEAIKEVLGESLKIITKTLKPSELAEIIMAKETQANAQNPPTGIKVTEDNILDQVINSFGGKVVEDE